MDGRTFTARARRGSLFCVTVPPLLFAAHGDRARSWADAIRRTRDVELLAAIDLSAGGIEGLDAALRARPDAAAMVWSAGPLESTALAERLLEHEGPTVLHPAPARPGLGTGVQVTHGWLSLSGIAAIERLFAASGSPAEVVRLRVRGVPEGPGVGLAPALYHAATVAHRFGRRVAVERAVLDDEQHLTLALEVDGVPWRVEVAAKKGPELQLVVRTSGGDFTWRADAISESLERSSAEPRALPAVSWGARCLRQITSPVLGADLADARAACGILDAVELALERRLPPTPFARTSPERASIAPSPPPELSGSFRISMPELSGSFRVSVETLEANALTRLGLAGELPDAATLAPAPPPTSADLPIEVIAYRLELRPAATLTIDPQDEERVRALLPGAIERREHERAGARKVELFAARDTAAAQKLAELSALDGADVASSLGAILGYPACCVQAFVAQLDHDESYDHYAIAARTSFGPAAWPALLDDTSLRVLPHQPCTYRCERSGEQARTLFAVLAVEEPALHRALSDYLGGPVLYFDHDHQLRFRGAVSEGGIVYERVSIPFGGSAPFAQLAGAIATGDRLVLSEGALTVSREAAPLFTLERADPGLGLILPFAPG